MFRGQRGDAGDESGAGDCGEREGCGDEEPDELFGFFGGDVDAVGEDVQHGAEGRGDDEDFGPGGECFGAGCCGCGEAVAEALPGAGPGVVLGEWIVAGECECGDGGDECADAADPCAGFEVDDAAELVGDGSHGVAGGAEGAEGEEPDGAVGAAGGEPAESSDSVSAEYEEEGEGGAGEGEDLEAAGVAGDGEVAGEVGGPGPGEEGAGEGDGGACGGEGAGDGGGQRDERVPGRCGVGGHPYHARSATRSPSRPWGRSSRTMMRRTKAHTSFQAPPPKRSMPGTSLM